MNPPEKMQDPGDSSADKVLSWLKAQEYAADNANKLSAKKILDNTQKLSYRLCWTVEGEGAQGGWCVRTGCQSCGSSSRLAVVRNRT